MKKNEAPATLAAALAELEKTRTQLARTQKKLDREKETSRLFLESRHEANKELARTRAELELTRAALDRAQERTDRAQDITDRVLKLLEKSRKPIENNYNSIITPEGEQAGKMPRHRRKWASFRPRRK